MTIEEAIETLRELAYSNMLADVYEQDLEEIANRLAVSNDFGINGFAMKPEEITELYVSIRQDLTEDVKRHDNLCKSIVEKYKFK